jgi:hypothetical protein
MSLKLISLNRCLIIQLTSMLSHLTFSSCVKHNKLNKLSFSSWITGMLCPSRLLWLELNWFAAAATTITGALSHLKSSFKADTVKCYHILLFAHYGTTWMVAITMDAHLYFCNMKEHVQNFVQSCNVCQHHKQPGQAYGHLPPRNDITVPWEEVTVDLVGPWKVSVPKIGKIYFHALTIIDTCTTIIEMICLENKTPQHVAMHFENQWLIGYSHHIGVRVQSSLVLPSNQCSMSMGSK